MFALKGRSCADPTINMSASAASKLHTRRIDSNAICLNRIVAGWNNPTEVHAAPLLRRRLQFQTPQILSAYSPHTSPRRSGQCAAVRAIGVPVAPTKALGLRAQQDSHSCRLAGGATILSFLRHGVGRDAGLRRSYSGSSQLMCSRVLHDLWSASAPWGRMRVAHSVAEIALHWS